MSRQSRLIRRLAAAAAVLLLGWLVEQAGVDLSWDSAPQSDSRSDSRSEAPRSSSAADSAQGARRAAQRIERAFEQRESGFMITVDARVDRILADDQDGSRHQRFLIALPTGRTLLVAHNIDLADRIAVDRGDSIRVRGQYEWNDRGGVLHWTHRDPAGRHPGGWIEHDGKRSD